MSEHTTVRIAEGTRQEITGGQLQRMISEWDEITRLNDTALLVRHGLDARRELASVLPTLVYVSIAKAAWSLASLADIEETTFSTEAFGKRCAEIAKEESDRYRTACKTQGVAYTIRM
jgi:hypothetical protein